MQILHWGIGALAICLIGAGLVMKFDLAPRPVRHDLTVLHIGFGLTMLVLMALRLAVRRSARPPPPAGISPLQRRVAAANHVGFYALLFAMPVFGLLFVEAKGRPIAWFGLVTLPALVGKDPGLRHLFGFLHFWGGMALLAMIALHVAAVIRHERRGESVLARMWRGRRPESA